MRADYMMMYSYNRERFLFITHAYGLSTEVWCCPPIYYICHKRSSNLYHSNNHYYDEKSQRIKDIYSLQNSLPKAFTIEVTDSVAYRQGLMDNDVIVVDGDYFDIPRPNVKLADFKAKRIFAINGQASRYRRMVVFRVNPKTKEYGLVAIDSIIGTDSENGFIAHVRYLTEKQRERIDNCCQANSLIGHNQHAIGMKSGDDTGKNSMLIVAPNLFIGNREAEYFKKIKEPSLVLAISVPDLNVSWKSSERLTKFWDLISETNKRNSKPEIILYVVKDGKTVECVTADDNLFNMGLKKAMVSDSIFHSYDSLAQLAYDKMDAEYKDRLVRLPRGRYKLVLNDTEWDLFPSYVELIVDSKENIRVKGICKARYAEGKGKYDLKTTIDSGKEPVAVEGNSIRLDQYASYECIYAAINGDSDLDNDELVKQMDSRLSREGPEKEKIKKTATWVTRGISRQMILHKMQDGYALSDEDGFLYRLQRIGKK